jgi:selenocysteine-specific elongation factor
MKNIIVGTAGHIDHGKTTLVGALTGMDTDRLAEEKRRGISIDLGFAHLVHAGVSFGFVDVPGHERFIKNMLAGASGIDLLLLVVAADEGVRPQTREHFEICRLLGLRHGVVALTKADRVDPQLALDEVREYVHGTFLENAPVIPVSGVTGLGLDELRAALVEAASHVETREENGPARLPIDRAFSVRGFGTVVTGTLVSGSIQLEDELELHPSLRRVRVRGLEVHGGPTPRAVAGQRTALNLTGIDLRELRRGMTLSAPALFESTRQFDCRIELLPSAAPLKHGAPIHLHTGTAEIEAEVHRLRGYDPFEPGASHYARIRLDEPALLLPGDRFIARTFSPVTTFGGGVVIDCAPTLRKHESLARLPQLEHATTPERVRLFASEVEEGARVAPLAARCGVTRQAVLDCGLTLVRDPEPRLVLPEALRAMAARLRAALTEFHARNPLLAGLARASAPVPAYLLDAVLAVDTQIVTEKELLRLATHRLALGEAEQQASARMEAHLRQAGLAACTLAEIIKAADLPTARTLFDLLVKQGRVVRLGPDLFAHADVVDSLRALIASKRGQRFSVAEFKQWTGLSRKTAIPLLEYLDHERLTRRDGDQRLVL